MTLAVKATIINDGKLLLVKDRRNSCWSLPGGKPHKRESYDVCLRREIAEELSKTDIGTISYFGSFSEDGRTFKVYVAKYSHGTYEPSHEINDVIWTSYPDRRRLSPITRKVIKSVLESGLI